jgi:hypothetical protein
MAYYLANRQEVDQYLKRQHELWEKARAEQDANPPPVVQRIRAMKTFAASCLCVFVMTVWAAPAQAQADPTYWQDIRPIFRKHCTVCHSARNLKEVDVSGGLALDTFDAARKGSSHAVFKPGHSKDSILYQLLTTSDAKRRMPLDAKPLPEADIALIKKWIDAGAKEGKDPGTTIDPTPIKKSAKLRKLDVVLPTNATPPAALLPKAKLGKLDLALRIGPLPPITALAFSPDGKTLAVGSHGQVALTM